MWLVPVSDYMCLTSWVQSITDVGNTNITLYASDIMSPEFLPQEKLETNQKIRSFHA
jgi:hypothetical protein